MDSTRFIFALLDECLYFLNYHLHSIVDVIFRLLNKFHVAFLFIICQCCLHVYSPLELDSPVSTNLAVDWRVNFIGDKLPKMYVAIKQESDSLIYAKRLICLN